MTWMPYVAVHTVKPYKKNRMASRYERDASFCHVIKFSSYGLPYVELLHTGCRMPGLPRARGGPISTFPPPGGPVTRTRVQTELN